MQASPAIQHEAGEKCGLGAAPESTYVPGMDRDQLRKILETLQTDEVEDVLFFVRVNEQAGHLSHEEAEEWRRQIRSRQTWLRLDD